MYISIFESICIFATTPLKMLSKINRLTKKKDFEAVFKKGKSVKNSFLIFKILNNNLKENRFGFIVSKKISNKATIRNKIKRRLRAIIAKELGGIKNYKDIIIIALPGIEKKEFSEIQSVITNFFKKI